MLFSPTLDAMIGADHSVRLFDEILSVQDGLGWEAGYPQDRGQPPIHPRAVASAEAMDEKRSRRKDGPDTAARVPVTDPEAKVLPNKEGGFAGNYTPTVAVEGQGGYMVDTEVLSGDAESSVIRLRRTLGFTGTRRYRRKGGGHGMYRVYTCESCAPCPRGGECLAGSSRMRRIFRDEHESQREAMRARRASPQGRAMSVLRRWRVEGTFGILKAVMGLRQFLLRGLEKVRTEWLGACTAFNLRKLVADVRRLRQRLAAAVI